MFVCIHELVSQAPRLFDRVVRVRERIRVATFPFFGLRFRDPVDVDFGPFVLRQQTS